MKHLSLWLAFIIIPLHDGKSQPDTLTLSYCQERALQNYPLIRKAQKQRQLTKYTVANIHNGWYPTLSLHLQATYQSDVTRVPVSLPNVNIETLNQDQYRAVAQANQILYDGGRIRQATAVQQAQSAVDIQHNQVDLYNIRDQVDRLFFNILLLDKKLEQLKLIHQEVESARQMMKTSVMYGSALQIQADRLQAEQLKIHQQIIETRSIRQSRIDNLALFIDLPLSEKIELQLPVVENELLPTEIIRPELKWFDSQKQLLYKNLRLTHTQNTPMISLFFQYGYGNPGLNRLQNKFTFYSYSGVQLQWNCSSLYNIKNNRQQTRVRSELIDINRETFIFNTRLLIQKHNQEIARMDSLIAVDQKIVALHTQIKNNARIQLNQGIITAHEFLETLTAEDQAIQNMNIHHIQRAQAWNNRKNVMHSPEFIQP